MILDYWGFINTAYVNQDSKQQETAVHKHQTRLEWHHYCHHYKESNDELISEMQDKKKKKTVSIVLFLLENTTV